MKRTKAGIEDSSRCCNPTKASLASAAFCGGSALEADEEVAAEAASVVGAADASAAHRQNAIKRRLRGRHVGTVITDKDHKRTLRTVLPPCNQIVERVNVWRKAEDDPTDGAPKNNSITHRLPPID